MTQDKSYFEQEFGISLGKVVGLAITAVLVLASLIMLPRVVEVVSADELVVLQSIGGHLTAYSTPGPICQCLGSVTSYKRRDTYEFDIPVRFNDGGHAEHMVGSVQFELPIDETNLVKLHKAFGSPESIKAQLVQKVVDKSVYMTGPLMSSTESYAAKRNYLISYIEDQIANGVYRTISHDVKVQDPITGQDKTATIVDILLTNGVAQRQEAGVLKEYGIRTSNFSIKTLTYDANVEAQIQNQQKITMDVQTSIAEAKKAEQRKITTEESGKADAAKAKWDQEVLKAKAVTEAEQQRDVSKLSVEAAENFKRQQTLLGEGEAARKRAVMAADGALEKKLEAYIQTQQVWATAFANYKGQLVPSVVMGGSSNGNSVQTFMDLLGAKAAKDLSLDLSLPRQTPVSTGARGTKGE